MRLAFVVAAFAVLGGCRNVLGIPDETTVESFEVSVRVTGTRGASDNPVQVFLDDMENGDRQTLAITSDGTFMFDRGLPNGGAFVVSTSPMCAAQNGAQTIDNGDRTIDVACDGLLGLADFGFSAPVETTGAPGSLRTYGSLLTQRTSLKPVPVYPEATATGFIGSAPVPDTGVPVMQNDTFKATIQTTTTFLPMTSRSFTTSLDLSGPPVQFGYGKRDPAVSGGHFGAALASYERYVLVGVPDEGTGHAVLYSRFGRAWTQVATFDGAAAGSRFGASVALGLDPIANQLVVVIGAPGAGFAYVFKPNGTQWDKQVLNSLAGVELGAAVAIEHASNGSRILVGAPGDSYGALGSAGRVLSYDIATLAPQATFTAPTATAGARFGSSLAIAADTRALVVGAPGERSVLDPNLPGYEQAGAAYVFPSVLSSAAGERLIASTPGAWDHFGASVAISADAKLVAIGAPLEDSNGTSETDNSADAAGAVYLFAGPSPYAAPGYLKAPNSDTGDGFGTALSIAGPSTSPLLAIGAPYEDSALAGVDKAMTDEAAPDAGAVYLYRIASGAPVFEHYLKASNAGAGDLLGAAISLADDSLLVAAPYEDSSATGWNGNQGDGAIDGDDGAVYAFR